jgi:hypothetical protein
MNHEPNAGTHDHGRGGHNGHGLMMIACCIPMLVIAVLLVATGVASPGFLLAAIACTAMMAFMMRGMSGTDTQERDG